MNNCTLPETPGVPVCLELLNFLTHCCPANGAERAEFHHLGMTKHLGQIIDIADIEPAKE